MYRPQRAEVTELAARHGLTRRIARLILQVHGGSSISCDAAVVVYLKKVADEVHKARR